MQCTAGATQQYARCVFTAPGQGPPASATYPSHPARPTLWLLVLVTPTTPPTQPPTRPPTIGRHLGQLVSRHARVAAPGAARQPRRRLRRRAAAVHVQAAAGQSAARRRAVQHQAGACALPGEWDGAITGVTIVIGYKVEGWDGALVLVDGGAGGAGGGAVGCCGITWAGIPAHSEVRKVRPCVSRERKGRWGKGMSFRRSLGSSLAN